MQALEWAVAHPEFSGRVVSIVGSPRLSGYEQILWRTMKAAIQSDAMQRQGNSSLDAWIPISAGLMVLALQTPEMISKTVPPEKAGDVIGQWEKLLAGMDANDRITRPMRWWRTTSCLALRPCRPSPHSTSDPTR